MLAESPQPRATALERFNPDPVLRPRGHLEGDRQSVAIIVRVHATYHVSRRLTGVAPSLAAHQFVQKTGVRGKDRDSICP